MKKSAAKSKKNSKKTSKVWRIFRFRERYEMPEDMRKCRVSALEFTRDFVGDAGGDEAVGYQHQFRLLSNGDGIEFSKLYGVYRQLVNMAAKRSRAYRGYLLDAKNLPLSDAQIGKLLRIETKIISKILRKLASVTLLEKVDLPIFDLSINEFPNKKNDDEKPDQRKGAEKSAQRRKPLKKGKKETVLNGNGKSPKNKNNGNGNRKHKTNAQEEQEYEDQTATAPTTTPPFMPRQSDEGGSVIPFTGPPGSVKNNRGPQKLGDITRRMFHRYDQDAKQFGADVYRALKLPWDPTSAQGRRELGSFAAEWMKAKQSGLPPDVLEKFRDRVTSEATKLSKRPPKRGNISAIWCSIFNKILSARCAENQCKAM